MGQMVITIALSTVTKAVRMLVDFMVTPLWDP